MHTDINIILSSTRFESMWKETKEKGGNKYYAFRGSGSYILSVIRKAWVKLNLPFLSVWYNRKLLELEGVCVLFDADISVKFLKWFWDHANHRKMKLFFYYWNACEPRRLHPDVVKKIGYSVWSFDPQNCKDYDMHLNPEFFCRSWYRGLDCKSETKYDIVFIGRDKNQRMRQINEIVERFQRFHADWYLYFTADKRYQRFSNRAYKPYLSYKKMLREQMKAKAILDYAQDVQSSITLRVFDALYNERKLITNNSTIRREPFYNPHNIFILNEDDDDKLEQFLREPFDKIPWELLRERSFEGWSQRFVDYADDEMV